MLQVLFIVGLAILIGYLINRSTGAIFRKRSIGYKNAQLIGVLLDLDKDRFDEVLSLYRSAFGPGAARYAKSTFKKWRSGKVLPTRRTFDRFYTLLPREMSFDLKCEILRKLKENYCAKENYDLAVTTDNWKDMLPPLLNSIAERSRIAELPLEVRERVEWLSHGEAIAANAILSESQARETAAALEHLDQEFINIEMLLDRSNGRASVSHSIKLPYGTINLKIEKA